jgi:predicted HTH domain antitoxin
MNTIKIEFEVPEALTSYINIKDPEYHRNVRELMIYQLIKDGKISFGKAAEILESDRITLITSLGKLGIPYFDYNIEEVVEDADNAGKVMEGNR